MDSLSMVITRGVKQKLARYGANLPVDKRTRAYAKILKDNNWTEGQYASYLKETVTKLKKKEDKKIKEVTAQTKRANSTSYDKKQKNTGKNKQSSTAKYQNKKPIIYYDTYI